MKILEFMVGVKKGSWCKSWKKKKHFFRFLSERQNLALYEGRIRTLQSNDYSVLPGKLHIVAEMVSKVQLEQFWMLFRIMSEGQKLSSPI